ncbi:dnaJ homolog subfamily C member 4 isoform X2 [Ictidomys tridecemlineatus]|uniref:dnaJ homolog subfamily C member 4 isoform X2 n=1 Tax=Ictidomys tridecemlineatus TaxID=43179 RepID=UPI001A9E89FC|nr:dnaJ homolog subfamily C member 4 isoform X2 [Ictidomys tridecemlineatus]
MRARGRYLRRCRKWRRLRSSCPPAAMLPLLPLRLCRLWPRSPPTRLLAAASGQRSGPRNYYELLGVHPGASAEEVKRAFFTKSKELHPDRDPGNPALHSRFVELNEAYRVLSREQTRRSYDHQLRSASSPKSPGTTAHPKSAQQTQSSWEPPNAQYWAQFHDVRPQGPQTRQQQYKHNQRVLGYCLLLMLAGMGLHYAAFRHCWGKVPTYVIQREILEQGGGGFRNCRNWSIRVNTKGLAGSWSRYTGASWMRRIGSSQPSTTTRGPGPGPTEPGSSRSAGKGSSSRYPLGIPKVQGLCLPAPAPEGLT